MDSPLWHRYGGHLTLFLTLILVSLGSLLITAADTADTEETATTSTQLLDTSSEELLIRSGLTPEATVDLTNVPLLKDTSLSPALNAYTYEPNAPEHSFQTYVVERGDTPNGIAEAFGLNPETLLGGNPFLSEESTALQTGVELIILPIDGVLHDVTQGQTLESLAQQYSVPTEDIIAYGPNNLEFPNRLEPRTQILVPGATRELFIWNPPQLARANRSGTSSEGRGVSPVIQGTGTFVWPVTSRYMTQNYWYGHPAIDVALPEGSAVVASDTGTVTYAGWNIYGYGNLIVVNHGNSYETFYAHLSGINVVPGQIVYQGNVIGATGNTGRSSGPHIHFEVRLNGNQDNPCWYVGC